MNLDADTITNAIFGTAGTGIFGILLLRMLWRRWSRDSLELAKDRAEGDIINTYKEDNVRLRDELNVLAHERNEAVAANGRLEAQVEIFKETIKKLEEENFALRHQISEQLKIIHSLHKNDHA